MSTVHLWKTGLPAEAPSLQMPRTWCMVSMPQDNAQLCAIHHHHCPWPSSSRTGSQRMTTVDQPGTVRTATKPRVPSWGKRVYDPQPYGPKELTMLATAPSLYDYQIIVVDAKGAYVCFAYGQGGTLMGLLHEDGHYEALTSLPAFFGKRPNTEEAGTMTNPSHPCMSFFTWRVCKWLRQPTKTDPSGSVETCAYATYCNGSTH